MLSRLSGRLVASYIRFAMQRAGWVLLAAAVLFAVNAWLGQRLTVDARIDALLPDDTASARANRELSQRLQSSAPLYLLVQAPTMELARQKARELHTAVSAWPETTWAMYKREPDYFLKHRLLYVAADDLIELEEQIDERRRYEQCKRIPGCVNLEDEPPPLPTRADLQALFQKDPDLQALVSLFADESSGFTEARPSAEAGAETPGATPAGPSALAPELGELCDERHNVCTVEAAIAGDASNLAFARRILERSEALFDSLRAAQPDAEVRYAVSGQFRNAPMMQRMVNEDLTKTSLLSIGLVLLVVFLQFRGWQSPVLLAVAVGSGIASTVGVVALVHPSLNIISSFTLAVLAGVGIDFGIHLLTHYTTARSKGEGQEAAMQTTFRALGSSLLVAAGTTACGFAALYFASFKGFSEMGPIAALGVVLSLVASVLLFPPLVAVLDRGETCPFALRSFRFDWIVPLRRRALPVASLGTLLALGAMALGTGTLGRGVEFEYDFSKLRPKDVSHGIPWTGTLRGTTRTAVYLLADDASALEQAAAAFRAEPPPGVVDASKPFLIVPGAFVPKDQERRLAAIRKLGVTLQAARNDASPELREEIDAFASLTEVETPIHPAAMPRWVTDWLTERDGRFGTLGILYASLGGSDARDMERLASHMAEWRERFPQVRFASPVAQLGEVTPRLRDEAPLILGFALLGVGLGTLGVGRSLHRALQVIVPLGVFVGLGLGSMAVFEIRVNLYNLLVFPLAFGIGIDAAVYVAWALAKREAHALHSAARGVVGSTLTTIAGFGSLMISNNPGLVSIGLLAVLMLGSSLVVSLIWLPAMHWAWSDRGGRRAGLD